MCTLNRSLLRIGPGANSAPQLGESLKKDLGPATTSTTPLKAAALCSTSTLTLPRLNLIEKFFRGQDIQNDLLKLNFVPRHLTGVELETKILTDFVQCLIGKNIHLVCFDFDSTLVYPEHNVEFINARSIHRRITPLFYALLELFAKADIYAAIVTYNTNPLLEEAFAYMKVPVLTRDDHLLQTGKSWHLDSAMNYFNQLKNLNDQEGIRPANVLLMDDDPNNIEIATRAGYHCIHNETVITVQDLYDFIRN